ncbi:hypothetical protein T08_1865 [Trichinella sp. T8]|nr:hypothetical protein T08_1865 [Trichinella sp. T8]
MDEKQPSGNTSSSKFEFPAKIQFNSSHRSQKRTRATTTTTAHQSYSAMHHFLQYDPLQTDLKVQ